jgi:hypothetical protein
LGRGESLFMFVKIVSIRNSVDAGIRIYNYKHTCLLSLTTTIMCMHCILTCTNMISIKVGLEENTKIMSMGFSNLTSIANWKWYLSLYVVLFPFIKIGAIGWKWNFAHNHYWVLTLIICAATFPHSCNPFQIFSPCRCHVVY